MALTEGPEVASKHLLANGIKDVHQEGYIDDNPYFKVFGFDIFQSNVGDLLHWVIGVPKYNAQDCKWFLR